MSFDFVHPENGEPLPLAMLNIHAMNHVQAAMMSLGMAHESTMPRIDWDAGPECVEAALRRHSPGARPGIPLHKLSTNDGWVISPQECLDALCAWKLKGSPLPYKDPEGAALFVHRNRIWMAWVELLEYETFNGGIRVR